MSPPAVPDQNGSGGLQASALGASLGAWGSPLLVLSISTLLLFAGLFWWSEDSKRKTIEAYTRSNLQVIEELRRAIQVMTDNQAAAHVYQRKIYEELSTWNYLMSRPQEQRPPLDMPRHLWPGGDRAPP